MSPGFTAAAAVAVAVCMLDAGLATAQMSTPPTLADGGNSTVLTNGVLSLAGTVTTPLTTTGTVHFNSTAAVAGPWHWLTTGNTGSAVGTLGANGGVLLDSSTATTGAFKVTAAGGRMGCWVNETSVAKTITSSTGSMVLGAAPSTTTVLGAYGHFCLVDDATSGYWVASSN